MRFVFVDFAGVTNDNINYIIITATLIILDIISGLICASKTGYDSTKMRNGLYHKSSYILITSCSIIIESLFRMPDFEYDFSIPMTKPILVYIMLTELISIYENSCIINPEISNFLSKIISSLSNKKTELYGGKDD